MSKPYTIKRTLEQLTQAQNEYTMPNLNSFLTVVDTPLGKLHYNEPDLTNHDSICNFFPRYTIIFEDNVLFTTCALESQLCFVLNLDNVCDQYGLIINANANLLDAAKSEIKSLVNEWFSNQVKAGNTSVIDLAYYVICEWDLYSILNLVDFLPKTMLLDVDFVPMNGDNAIYMDYLLTPPDFHAIRSSVENNQIKLFNATRLPSNFLADANFVPWVYMYRSDICFMVNKEVLPSGHWALEYIMELDEEEFKVQGYNGRPPTSKAPVLFNRYDINVCDYYTIVHKDETLIIDNIAVAYPGTKKGILLFPLGVRIGDDQILRQVKTYEVNLKHDQLGYGLDKELLLKWVQTTKKRRAFTIVK